MRLYHLHLCRNLCLKSVVYSKLLRIFRSVDDRLPTFRRKVLGKLYPTLNTGASCRRPIIGYDKDSFHQSAKLGNLQQIRQKYSNDD